MFRAKPAPESPAPVLGATGKPSTWLPVVKLAELLQSHMNVLVPLILQEFPLYVSSVLELQIMSFSWKTSHHDDPRNLSFSWAPHLAFQWTCPSHRTLPDTQGVLFQPGIKIWQLDYEHITFERRACHKYVCSKGRGIFPWVHYYSTSWGFWKEAVGALQVITLRV